MKHLPNMQKGFLFDYKWIPTLRDLEPKDFHIIFWQLLDFQQSNGSKIIPRHRGRRDLDYIVNLIVPQLENRLNGSVGGRTAHERSASKGGTVPPTLPPTEGSTVLKISQDKLSQVKLSQGECELSQAETGERYPSALCGAVDATKVSAAGGTRTQKKETENCMAIQADREAKQAYGEEGNVYLTPTQYKTLTEDEGIPPAYIDRYSLRLTQGNYHPSDHASTLRAWWAEDKEAFTAWASGGVVSRGEQSQDNPFGGGGSSFDVDTFFDNAVRKSLGNG